MNLHRLYTFHTNSVTQISRPYRFDSVPFTEQKLSGDHPFKEGCLEGHLDYSRKWWCDHSDTHLSIFTPPEVGGVREIEHHPQTTVQPHIWNVKNFTSQHFKMRSTYLNFQSKIFLGKITICLRTVCHGRGRGNSHQKTIVKWLSVRYYRFKNNRLFCKTINI